MLSVDCLQSGFDDSATYDEAHSSPTPTILALKRGAILLIDNRPEALKGLSSVLEQAGYACACAATADSARESLRRLAPDLIIAESNLGGTNGVAMCESLLKEESLDTPRMYLSDTQIPDIIRRCHGSGGAYHLRKPCDHGVLLSLVGKALAQNRFEPAGA